MLETSVLPTAQIPLDHPREVQAALEWSGMQVLKAREAGALQVVWEQSSVDCKSAGINTD